MDGIEEAKGLLDLTFFESASLQAFVGTRRSNRDWKVSSELDKERKM